MFSLSNRKKRKTTVSAEKIWKSTVDSKEYQTKQNLAGFPHRHHRDHRHSGAGGHSGQRPCIGRGNTFQSFGYVLYVLAISYYELLYVLIGYTMWNTQTLHFDRFILIGCYWVPPLKNIMVFSKKRSQNTQKNKTNSDPWAFLPTAPPFVRIFCRLRPHFPIAPWDWAWEVSINGCHQTSGLLRIASLTTYIYTQ